MNISIEICKGGGKEKCNIAVETNMLVTPPTPVYCIVKKAL